MLRDADVCGYCLKNQSNRSTSIDQIHPKSAGGKNTWENLITACKPCNNKKGNKIGIKPKLKPYKPTYYDLAKKMQDYKGITNTAWARYV